MNRKEKQLVDAAMAANADGIFGDSGKCSKYDKVANKIDNWDKVRVYIFKESAVGSEDDETEYFEDAALRYNASVREPELTNKQKAGTLAGAGLAGLALGLLSDPNKRGPRCLPKRKGGWG